MVDTQDLILAGGVSLLLVALIGLAASVKLPGTAPISGGSDGPPRCDLDVRVGVQSNENPIGDKIKINEDSFDSTVTRHTLFGLSVIGPGTTFSALQAENVEMRYTLTGPTSVPSKTDSLGNVGRIGASKLSEAGWNNLEQGTYTVDMDLTWNTGRDSFSRQVEVTC